MIWRSDIVSGRPSETTSILTPKVSSSFVFRKSRFRTRSASAPFFSSMTIRMPSFDDWLDRSAISGAWRLSASAATSFMNFPMPAPTIVYGISVTTRFVRPFLPASVSTRPRIRIRPLPVR